MGLESTRVTWFNKEFINWVIDMMGEYMFDKIMND